MLGVMPIEKAMDLANEKKLDLVNISPNAKPAVCKILDYGKYRYELQKKEKEAKKKAEDYSGERNQTFNLHRSPRYSGKSQDCRQVPCRRRQGQGRSALQRKREIMQLKAWTL